LAALSGFRELMEDARSMLAGTFVERVGETADQMQHGDAEAWREAGCVLRMMTEDRHEL